MGCPRKVFQGDSVVFGICTHDPDTGVLTDADSAPIYRVYEDETTTPIDRGIMRKLDDANTTGFYTCELVCASWNNYNVSKSYNIYVEATVDGETGGMSYAFVLKGPPTYRWNYDSIKGLIRSTKFIEAIVA